MGKWLTNQFVFYASYHNDFVNQIVHIIFVPLIVLGACVLFSFTPSYGTFHVSTPMFAGEYPINLALVYSVTSAMYYTVLELPGFAGFVAGTGMVGAYAGATSIMKAYSPDECWMFAWFAIIFGFAVQIFAHQVYEKRSPALLDNIFQAFVMAPLFVVMETLFFMGYRSKFRKEAQKDVDKNIKAFRASQAKGK
jgi:2-hydroxy fatty acid dioxygenase